MELQEKKKLNQFKNMNIVLTVLVEISKVNIVQKA